MLDDIIVKYKKTKFGINAVGMRPFIVGSGKTRADAASDYRRQLQRYNDWRQTHESN